MTTAVVEDIEDRWVEHYETSIYGETRFVGMVRAY